MKIINNKSLLALFFAVILAILTVSTLAAPAPRNDPVDEHVEDEDIAEDEDTVDDGSEWWSWGVGPNGPYHRHERGRAPRWLRDFPGLVRSCWGWC